MVSLLVSTTTMEATTAVRDADAVCAAIVESIADHTDADPLDMTPLATVVDTDALDALVGSAADVQVAFEYEGHSVHVRADGTVTVDGDDYSDPATDGDR